MLGIRVLAGIMVCSPWAIIWERKLLVLTVTQGPDKGAEFSFTDESRVIIGRGSPHFKLADRMVSHAHARLKVVDNEWFIRDMQSRNGTFVNGIPVLADFKIDSGDEIKVGFSVLRFDLKVADPDAVSIGDVDFDAIESLNLLPDESQKFETIESLINLPDDEPTEEQELSEDDEQALASASMGESENVQVPDSLVEPVVEHIENPAVEAESDAPSLKLADSPQVPGTNKNAKPRKPLTPIEAAGIELIGVLAFDQVTPMVNRQVDGSDLTTPMDPAPRANESSAEDDEQDHEGPANEWKSLVDNTVSTNDGHAWDTDEEDTQRPESEILDDLSREEDPESDATEEQAEENDISFEDYIKEQQQAADAEAAIEQAAASRKN